jgi:hypothetical protein
VDSAATSLTGLAGRIWLNKQNGRVMSNSGLGFLSPKFEVNDVGQQSRSNVINGHSMLGYQWTADGKYKRYANVWGTVSASRNFDGDLTSMSLSEGGNANFKNNWNAWWDGGFQPRTTDVGSTRGGPKMQSLRNVYMDTGLNTDSYKKTFVSPYVNMSWDEAGGYYNGAGIYVEWKPRPNLLVSAGPFLNRGRTIAQYVATAADPSATETFGQRYVFAQLDQTTVGADLRINWTFTPTLSLETYLQPFISSGEYSNYKSLARPGTFEFDPYAFGGNPNFDFGSLRGNAIMRWEYSPGSTLFLVWTQQRSDFANVGDFDLRRGMSDMLDARADNVFLAKLSYHLGL